MTAGAVASVKSLFDRWQWEENNVLVGIMLDWDDVHAVATRANGGEVEALLREYAKQAAGAIYLSLPELTLNRLLQKGELSTVQGSDPQKVYLRAQNEVMADLVTTELQARLPHIGVTRSKAKNPLISFSGDLPTVAEVGLGFNPAHAELAYRVGLAPVPRPIGFSWVQAEMIERTLTQAANLGAKIVAIQGELVPGHEFNMDTTIETLRRHHLKCAYFCESRHQRGDWHLVKNLTEAGLIVLAHEFAPEELLEEDWNTVSSRWATLAVEAGIRLCSVRFFRVIHAGDPLESVAYIQSLTAALQHVGLVPAQVGAVDLTPYHPQQTPQELAALGLGVAGAVGLAADLFPIPDELKLLGVGAAALGLGVLPFAEKQRANGHHHDDPDHHHDDHRHDHAHGHSHGPAFATTYASKGIALASALAYPAAAIAINGANPVGALTQALVVGTAGAATLGAATADADYVLGVEPYRSYNLDWLLPLSLAAGSVLFRQQNPKTRQRHASEIQNQKFLWSWLPLVGLGLVALKNFGGGNEDPLVKLDREHRHSHTHHLSAFQRILGDSKMAVAPKPLRKWSLLAPLGAVGAALLKQKGQDELATVALTAAAAGQVATLAGFRNTQRPLLKTLEGRARGWAIGAVLAGVVWGITWLLSRR